jgi:hypothetical protein
MMSFSRRPLFHSGSGERIGPAVVAPGDLFEIPARMALQFAAYPVAKLDEVLGDKALRVGGSRTISPEDHAGKAG